VPLPQTSTPRRRFVALGLAIALLAGACTGEPTGEERAAERGLAFEGPDESAVVNAEQLEQLTFTVTAGGDDTLDDLRVLLDGDDVTGDAEVQGGRLTYAPGELPDGERTVAIAEAPPAEEQAGDDGAAAGDEDGEGPEPLHRWRFAVKAQPPELELTSPDGPALAGEPITVAGSTDPGATVAVGTQEVTADESGAFSFDVDDVEGDLTIRVTDEAGNTIESTQGIAVVASRVEVEEVRTVHATFWAWNTPSLRGPIEQMIEDGRINSLQLDLKDEGGHIGYDSQVPLAQDIGAGIGPLDLEETVAELHDQGIAVVGRIVAFADPMLAAWAWENGERDMVIQVPDGSDYYRGSYAGFSNFTHEDVIGYLLDLAEEAAQAGVDHILWDYIRRPEGMDNYTVPGLETTPEEAIVEFSRQADERLAPYGVQHGASVYGIAADRPEQIGQDIPAMAEHLDYMAPMIYPSHWGPGEYDVADPNRQPYDIIRATLEVWDEATAGTRARIVPWLEDTPYRAWDRPHQVREQIRAAREHGIDEWLMWNPGSSFTPAAYEQRE
jgi:hypothetical protein